MRFLGVVLFVTWVGWYGLAVVRGCEEEGGSEEQVKEGKADGRVRVMGWEAGG